MTKTQNQLSVLIVDDSALAREAVRAALSNCDALRIAGEAVDVRTGIEAVQTLQPDLVILDMVMPGGSGIDVLRQTRQLPSVPLVLLFSNFMLPCLKEQYGRAGADFLFDKGTEFETLCQAVIKAALAFCKHHTLPAVLN